MGYRGWNACFKSMWFGFYSQLTPLKSLWLIGLRLAKPKHSKVNRYRVVFCRLYFAGRAVEGWASHRLHDHGTVLACVFQRLQ